MIEVKCFICERSLRVVRVVKDKESTYYAEPCPNCRSLTLQERAILDLYKNDELVRFTVDFELRK